MNSFINNCINIENNIKDINNIYEIIKNINLNKNIKIKFIPEEENNYNDLLESIKVFGKVCYNNYKFRKCPNNIKEDRKYSISGEKDNIITKTGNNAKWMGTICEDELEKGKEHKWKINIIKTYDYSIMVGVAPSDFDINSSSFNTCGWYFNLYNSYLLSGPPHNYSRNTNLKSRKDEIIVIMNMNKRTLKFIINNEDKGESYTNIPIDKPLFPAILLHDQHDSVEIFEC